MNNTSFTFPKYPIGSHQEPWDLAFLLYKSAAIEKRKIAKGAIAKGKFGGPKEERLTLIEDLHDVIPPDNSSNQKWKILI
ncbi:MAG: hypothetical protein HWE13_01205 [Gammaproteobacteria bacterium]|nr:hypothetical protein [Gammaproteobacteria bacterium]